MQDDAKLTTYAWCLLDLKRSSSWERTRAFVPAHISHDLACYHISASLRIAYDEKNGAYGSDVAHKFSALYEECRTSVEVLDGKILGPDILIIMRQELCATSFLSTL